MNLADALMGEISRVRDVIMPRYCWLVRQGETSCEPALLMMRAASDRAIRALAEQDATRCLSSLEELRGFTD